MIQSTNSPSPGNPPNAVSILPQVRRFVRELKRLWWIPVLGGVVLFLVAKFVMEDKPPALFTCVARMWVGGKIKLAESSLYQEEVQNFYGTQMELMQSKTVQRRAHERVRKARPELPETPVKLAVLLSPRAAVFTLTASGVDQQYVQSFLNAVMDEFLEYKREVRAQSADFTLVSITGQLGRLDSEFGGAQEKLSAFLRTNSVAALQEQGTGAGSYLAELNRKFADLKLQRDFLEMLAAEKRLDGGPLNNGSTQRAGDLQLGAMREISVLKSQKEDLARYLRPKHPKMISLEDGIRQQEELLVFARKQGREELRQRLLALDLEMKNIETVIREWEDRVLSASSRMAEHDRLKQTVERTQRLYDQLLSMIRNVDVNKNLDQEVLAVLERAEPVLAVANWSASKELLGALTGAIGGLCVIFLLMLASDKVTTVEELESKLSETVIGQIPELTKAHGHAEPLLLESGDSRHGFAESFKSIRSSLFYSTVGGNRPRSILVTSAIPGEGKSIVAMNLARAFAFAGCRVLLVEGDLRCGVLHRLLNVPNEPGLTDVLRDGLGVNQAVVHTSVPNLSFIPKGSPADNPGELFLGPAADSFLSGTSKDYDYVIIDSVPILAADDTTSLAPKVDGIVFVVRGAFTSIPLARRALELLRKRQGCVLGVVCNRSASHLADYNYARTYQTHRDSNGHTTANDSSRRVDVSHAE